MISVVSLSPSIHPPVSQSWISNGLREFWDQANIFGLAVKGFFEAVLFERSELYCAGQGQKYEPQNYLQP
jgi:hypothetical protein